MKYLIHQFDMRAALFYVNYPTVKLKLGANFSQFIHRFKYRYDYDLNMSFLSVGLMLYFQIFLNSQRDFGTFLMLLQLDFSILPNSKKKSLSFQFVTNSLKSLEIWILEVSLILYLSDCEDSLRHGMFVGEMGTPFKIKLPVFKKKKCSCLNKFFFVKVLGILLPSLTKSKNSKTFLGCHQPLGPAKNVFGTNHTCLPTPLFTQIFLNIQ